MKIVCHKCRSVFEIDGPFDLATLPPHDGCGGRFERFTDVPEGEEEEVENLPNPTKQPEAWQPQQVPATLLPKRPPEAEPPTGFTVNRQMHQPAGDTHAGKIVRPRPRPPETTTELPVEQEYETNDYGQEYQPPPRRTQRVGRDIFGQPIVHNRNDYIIIALLTPVLLWLLYKLFTTGLSGIFGG
jgi:hypothetical protein